MHIIVIGGGLAGLTAAASAAALGADVTLLEGAGTLGGRARSQDVAGGFRLNLGPHALYRGDGVGVLEQLGVDHAGGVPVQTGSVADTDGGLLALPLTPAALLRSPALTWRGRLQVALALGRVMQPSYAAAKAGRTWGDWLDDNAPDPSARRLLDALGRLASYAADPAVDAEVPLRQMRTASAEGVLYVHRGWQHIVDGLAEAARGSGVTIRTGLAATAVRPQGAAGWEVDVPGGRRTADGVVVAVPPRAAGRLLRDAAPTALLRRIDLARPVRAAVLDLALDALPDPGRPFALGLDRPSYLSVHSLAAKLAPEGGAVVHLARYLHGEGDPRTLRDELELLADRVQPGWRAHVVRARFLPHLTVTGDAAPTALGGLAGRTPVEVADGLALAGDWVGPRGWLAEAALLSGRAAGMVVARRSPGVVARRTPVTAVGGR